ncbi:TPA: 16S rRNA processing protein RimM [Candidatus Latescibacteria bacterium]|nr:16S rRNA processing protein RimM [Candidatus Latescibacterota bacterium]|tara:strand:+ start:413 stop:940 length:528 start_codon:yes stop_codon:yes gene_type:complete
MTQPSRLNLDEEVAVGKLQKPRGIHGEIFCLPLTDYVERFGELDIVTAILHGGRREPLTLENARMYGRRLALKFAGYDTPEDVGTFRDAEIVIPKDQIFDLPEDTFYVFDIVGMAVETEDGDPVGTVKEVMSLPGNDVYVVDRNGDEVLIPAVKDLVTVDGSKRKIVVQLLEGLV